MAKLGLQMIWSILLLGSVQICLLGRVTGPWHPKEDNLHHSASDGLSLDWLPGWKRCIVFFLFSQMSNICMEFVSFLSSDAKVGQLFRYLISLDKLLISTSDCKFLVFFMIPFSEFSECLLHLMLLNLRICQICFFKHVTAAIR